jgi:hypothetical protein
MTRSRHRLAAQVSWLGLAVALKPPESEDHEAQCQK